MRTEAEWAFILGQMRLFLQSTQTIAVALGKNDLKTVEDEAAAWGRKGTPASAIPPGMNAKETPAWTAMMTDAPPRQLGPALDCRAAKGRLARTAE